MIDFNNSLFTKLMKISQKYQSEKSFLTFYYFYDSLVEVMNDFEDERIKENGFNAKEHNPLENCFACRKEKIIESAIKSLAKFIMYLKVQESTVVVAFIYLDRFLKKDKNILSWKSFEK